MASSPNSPRGAVFSSNLTLITALVVKFTHTEEKKITVLSGCSSSFLQQEHYASKIAWLQGTSK